MKEYGFGVDLGGTTCKIGLFKTNGELLDKWEIKTNTENNGAFILDDIANAIEAKYRHHKLTRLILRELVSAFQVLSQQTEQCISVLI